MLLKAKFIFENLKMQDLKVLISLELAEVYLHIFRSTNKNKN